MLEGKYERIKKIAEGAYGIVYKAIDHSQLKKEGNSISHLTKTLAETAISSGKTNTENVSPNTIEESKEVPLVEIKKLRVQEDGDEIYAKEINFLKNLTILTS